MAVLVLVSIGVQPVQAAGADKILFVALDLVGTDAEVKVMDADGTNQTNLTNDLVRDDGFTTDGGRGAAWSPDGSKIAFVRETGVGTDFALFVMNADGSNRTQVSTGAQDGTLGISWAPDSSKIAFTRITPGPIYEIYTVHPDGTNETQLTNTTFNACPAYSPDGTKISFMSGRDGDTEMYTMNPDGSAQTNVSNNPSATDGGSSLLACSHDWSPDSSKIVYSSDVDLPSSGYAIYTANRDGSGRTAITTPAASVLSILPDWSPDGTKIMYASNAHDPGGAAAVYDIYTVNSDGSSVTRLTGDSTSGDVLNDSALQLGYSWSPDSTRIAFGSVRSGATSAQVYIMNADGSSQTALTSTLFSFLPVWKPASLAGASSPVAATLVETGLNSNWIRLAGLSLLLLTTWLSTARKLRPKSTYYR